MVLLDFDLFMANANDLKNHFNPTYFTDCEFYLEKLIKIKDKLKKEELKRQKWHKKLYGCLKPLWYRFFSRILWAFQFFRVYIFLIFLTEATNILNVIYY